MKKKILTTIILPALVITSLNIIAQPTITATGINPLVGEQFTSAFTNYANPGNSGANQIWNLSSLVASAITTTNVINPTSTSSGASFINSNFAAINSNSSTVHYYKSTLSNLQYYGNDNFIEIYSNPIDILHYPFTFNDLFVDTYASQFTNGSGTYNHIGLVTVLADGYGTLITPNGSYNNVLRLHKVEIDSTFSNGTLVGNFIRDGYYWYTNGVHLLPLASVMIHTDYSGGTTFTTQMGSYLKNLVGISENNKLNSNLFLYPNPVADRLTVQFNLQSESLGEIKIVNTIGAIVKEETLENLQTGINAINISTAELANGVYFIQLKNGNTIETKRFVVSK